MYLLVLLLPLISSFCCGLLGFFLGRQASLLLSCGLLFLSFLVASCIFYEIILGGSVVTLSLWDWLVNDHFTIHLGLLYDPLTSFMLLVITFISFLVHIYSIDYMSHDPYQTRFFCYLSLFTFFMLFLVTADNFLQLFAGWEGVGLCSYLLINFWFTRILANKAALKAMIMNRIADVFFVFAIVLLFLHLGTTDYILVFSFIPLLQQESILLSGFEISFLNAVGFFLFIGAIGKSAQLGFHTWLPDAMEGPTPVSSLLHAATMVTAGVFLLLRCSPLLQYTPGVLLLVTLIGGLTAFFFALVGIFQYDIKKVIAYSTCSQLGYMFLSCGLSNYSVAAFHLFNHAFFKALLFLGAGAIIHSFFDEQDMRRMGNSLTFLPFTYLVMLIGSIAILGLPFLAGFYSKDLLLELAFLRLSLDSLFIYSLGVLAALFTSIYSLRLLLLVFLRNSFSFSNTFPSFRLTEVSPYMYFPLIILALSSILSGYLFVDLFVGFGGLFWSNSLMVLPQNFITLEADYLSPWIKSLPILLSLLGSFLGLLFYEFYSLVFVAVTLRIPSSFFFLHSSFLLSLLSWGPSSFFYNSGYFNSIYNSFYLIFYRNSYAFSSKLLDKGFLEIFGPFGLYLFWRRLSLFFLAIPSSLFFNIFFFFICFCFMLLLFLVYLDVFNFSYLGLYLLSFLLSLGLLALDP